MRFRFIKPIHDLAPPMTVYLAQNRHPDFGPVVNLNELPIDDDLDKRDFQRIPMPPPWQDAAEKKLAHDINLTSRLLILPLASSTS